MEITPRANIDLVVRLFGLFSDNLNCMRNWGFYLFSPEFDDEQELRNRIGTIWLTSLLDSLEGEIRSINSIRHEAMRRSLPHLLQVCEQASLFMDCIKDIIRLYSRTEQIFLNDVRDQLVHSWLARRHATRFHIKYFDGYTIVKERLTPAEHANIVRPFYLSGTLDQSLYTILKRFQDSELRYWHVINELSRVKCLDALQDEMLAGKSFRIEALTVPIAGPAVFIFK